MTDVQVRGTYLLSDDTPASGRIHFTPRASVVNDSADGNLLIGNAVVATLDDEGSFSVTLQASDDPGIDPAGWTYAVQEELAGWKPPFRVYDIEVPTTAAGPGIDLVDIVPASAAAGDPSAFPTLASVAALEDRIEAIEDAGPFDPAGAAAAAQAAAIAALPPTAQTRLGAGRMWAFAGDSITDGSGSSNVSWSLVRQAVTAAGHIVAASDSVESGVPSDTSTMLLARFPAILATGAESVAILIGTNDAGSAVPLATTAANITSMVRLAKLAGCPVVLCTPPPRGSGASAAIQRATAGIGAWIKLVGPRLGCEVADGYTALIDPTTGLLGAAYDSGDGTHPSNLGHQVLGAEIAKAMRRLQDRQVPVGLLTSALAAGVITADPLNARATATTSPWSELAGGTGTAPSYSMVSDISGVLPAGRWVQMDFDGTAAGGVRRLITSVAAGGSTFAVGDKVMIAGHIQIEDVTGTWRADAAADTAAVSVSVVNQSNALIAGTSMPARVGGIASAVTAGVYDIGPLAYKFTVPASTTSMTLWLAAKVATGKRVKFRFGAVGMVNLTQLGADAYVGTSGVQSIP